MTGMLIKQTLAMVLMALAGFLAGKAGVLTGEESRGLSKACVYVVVPCCLVDAFRTEFEVEKLMGLMVCTVAAVLIHLLYLAIDQVLMKRGKAPMTPGERASVIYSNSGNLIIPLVQGTLGSEYVIYICSYLIVQNLLTWTHGQRLMGGTKPLTVKNVLTNPAILSILLGTVLFFMRMKLPGALGTAVSSLGACIGPLSMVLVGLLIAEMDLKEVFCSWQVWRTVAIRLLLCPALVMVMLWGFHLAWRGGNSAAVLTVMMLCASGPSASIVVQLAQLYNSPERGVVSSVNALSTLMCALTLPAMCILFQQIVA